MTKIKSDKVTKSISLTPPMAAKLEIIAEEIGVNVHAYMIAELGKAIQRDYLAYHAKKIVEDQSTQMMTFFEGIINKLVDESEVDKK